MKLVGSALGLALVMVGTTAGASDAPFGLEMGTQPSEYGCEPPGGYADGVVTVAFVCTNVPTRSEYFQTYMVMAADEIGICTVFAYSQGIETASQTKRTTDDIAEFLADRHGNDYEKLDTLTVNGISSDDPRWLLALKSDDYAYSFRWNFGASNSQPSGIASIDLVANSHPIGGYISLLYTFANKGECERAWQEANDRVNETGTAPF